MSAALLITALVMSNDQRVTGNNTFKDKHTVTKAEFYTRAENVPAETVIIKDLSFI